MMPKKIIGLTLNYRDAIRTSRCIESLLRAGAQSVLVWDNSADGGQSAGALRQGWAANDRVEVIESPQNLGFAAGVNRGIGFICQRWPGYWVFLLNNDATVDESALQRLADALHRQPQAALAYPRIRHGQRIIGTLYYQRWFALLSFDDPLPGSFAYPSGAALLLAPERIELPVFDEDFFMYGEDVLLGWRLGRARMAHVAEALVHHEANASSRNGSLFYETHVAAGHWLLGYKLARGPLNEALLLGARCLSLPMRAVLRAFRSRSLAPLIGCYLGWQRAAAVVRAQGGR